MMKYVLKRGGKMGGSFQVKIQLLKLRIGQCRGRTLASFYKDDNYRSPLLELGIKSLEMLITGGFFNLLK